MAAGRYSAGRVFVQIVPSFDRFQEAIRSEVEKYDKTLGAGMADRAEKSGAEAGRRYGKAQSAEVEKEAQASAGRLKKIQTDQTRDTANYWKLRGNLARQGAQDEVKSQKESQRRAEDYWKQQSNLLRSNAAQRISALDATRKAEEKARADQLAQEQRQQENLNQINARAMAARIKEGQRAAKSALDAVRKAEEEAARNNGGKFGRTARAGLAGASDSIGPLTLTADSNEADRALARLQQRMREVHDLKIGVDIDEGGFKAKVAEIERELRKIDGKKVTATAGVNLGAALAELALLRRELNSMDRDGKRFGSSLSGAGEDGANAFRIFRPAMLGVVTLLPMIVPLAVAAAGAIAGLGTAAVGAGAGLGAMILGFSGIGAAVTALGQQANNAGKDALQMEKAARTAAKGIRDAEQGVARAREDAARGAEDAARRIADAQRGVADAHRQAAQAIQSALKQQESAERSVQRAQRDSIQAEKDLVAAKIQAAQDIKDLQNKAAEGALSERQAVVDLFDATTNYNAVMADGGATNKEKEQASIDLERAKLALKEIREENAKTAAEKKKADAEGVNGSEKVKAAQQGLTDAQQAQLDAQNQLKEAQAGVTQARVDGARQIADAERAVSDAVRASGRQQVDSTAAIRDAQERLGDAIAASKEKLDTTPASVLAVQNAMAQLGPAGQAFARYIDGLRGKFYALRDAVQEAFLPKVMTAMQTIINTYGPSFQKFMASMGGVMGDILIKAANLFTSPMWKTFFDTMGRYAGTFSRQFGDVFLNVLTIAAGIMTAFAPYAKDLGDSLVTITGQWALWAAGLAQSKGFQDFLAYLQEVGPKVWDLIIEIVGALINLGIGLAPYADQLIGLAVSFFGFLANLDPGTLAAIVEAVLGLVIASQLAAGIMAFVISATTPFASMVGAAVFTLIGLTTAIIIAYQKSERFRAVIDAITGFVKENWKALLVLAGVVGIVAGAFAVVSAWTTIAATAMYAFEGAIAILTAPITLIILAIVAIGIALIVLYRRNETFRNGINAIWSAIKTAFSATFSAIGAGATWLWEKVLRPVFGWISTAFGALGTFFKATWDKVLWPIVDLFGSAINKLWTVWIKPALGWIGDKFGALGTAISDFWKVTVQPILDKFGNYIHDTVAPVFQKGVDKITGLWDTLSEKMKTPIKAVIGFINDPVIKGFNNIADFFGSDHITPIPLPKGWHTGGYTGPGEKYQPAGIVHADEYVIRKESTNKLRRKYGLGVLDHLNQFGELPGMGYAIGGLVGNARKMYPIIENLFHPPEIGGYRSGPGAQDHAKGLALDVMVYKNAALGHNIAAWAEANAKKIGLQYEIWQQQIWNVARSNEGWRHMADRGSPTANHFDHVHLSFKGDGVTGKLGDWASAAGDMIASPFNWLKDQVTSKLGGLTKKIGDSPFAKMLTAIPMKVVDIAKDKIAGFASQVGDFGSNAVNKAKGIVGNGTGNAYNRRLGKAMASSWGWDGQQWSSLEELWNHESSWQTGALNRDSGAYGIPQALPASKMASAGPDWHDNPATQIRWGLDYIKGRYGSPVGALQHWKDHNWYAKGGLVGAKGDGLAAAEVPYNGAMMFDSGGMLPTGLTTVLNMTGKPEPVFTSMSEAASKTRHMGGGDININVPMMPTNSTPGDVAAAVTFAARQIRLSPVYGR